MKNSEQGKGHTHSRGKEATEEVEEQEVRAGVSSTKRQATPQGSDGQQDGKVVAEVG